MKKYIFILLLAVVSAALSAACGNEEDLGPLESVAVFSVPSHNSTLTVADVRVRGFTLSWDDLPGRGHYYAIAASRSGNIGTYEEALENGHIILDFTCADILGGTYRATGRMPGSDYEIKLFVRMANTRAAEFLTARTTLPFIDEVEITSLWFDGEAALSNRHADTFTRIVVPTLAELERPEAHEYTVTYRLPPRTQLFDQNGELMPEEFTIRKGEEILVTAVNDRTNASRDYLISVTRVHSGLPLIIIETEDMRPIVLQREYVNARMKIFDGSVNPYRQGLFEDEPIDMIMRTRGSVALRRPKRSFIIRTPDGSRIPILDMAPGEDWVLLSNYADRTLMRNYIAHELFRDMGAIFSPRLRFVDLVFNGDFIGTYMIGERIKIDPGRFELPRIRAHEYVRQDDRVRPGDIIRREGNSIQIVRPASTPEELTGSYVLELKSTASFRNHEIIFETSRVRWNRGNYFRIQQPGPNNLTIEAFNFISNFVNDAENALFGEDFRCPVVGYRAFLDVATFIDWYIVNELFKRLDSDFADGIFFYKPRGGLLSMGPVWDFETAAGNHPDVHSPEGWHVRYAPWFTRLFQCERFEREFRDRWNFVREHILEIMFIRIDYTAWRLERSQQLNFERWPILGRNIWPYPPGAITRHTFQREVDHLKDWLAARIEWMDNEINQGE